MRDFTRLNESIKQIAKGVYNSSKPTAVMFGVVISRSPLKIEIEQKLTLSDKQLILTRRVAESNDILRSGSKVILIRLEGGQKFLVLDEVGG